MTPRPTLWLRAVAAISIGAGFLSLTAKNAVDFDTWHQMTSANDVLAGHADSRSDPYTFTETIQPIVHHEWGVGLISYFATSRFGAGALLLIKYALLSSTILLVFCSARNRAGEWEDWALIAVPAIPLISVGFMMALRAQMFSFLFVAMLLAALQIDEAGKRWWIGPCLLVFPVWVNLHAGCTIAIVLLCAAAVERVFRRMPFLHLLCTAGFMIPLLMLNPFGFRYYEFLLRALPLSRPNISEWEPLWKVLAALVAFLVCVFTIGLRITEKGARKIMGWGILLVTALIAVRAVKMAPLFGLAWIAYAPGIMRGTRLQRDIEEQNRATPWRPAVCWLALFGIFALLASMGQWSVRIPGQPIASLQFPPYPVGAVEYLSDQEFSGNVLAPFEFGAYVTWKLGRSVRVFMDSRYEEVYPVDRLDEVIGFYTARPNWRDVLGRYAIDAVIVPNSTAVASVMPGSGWNRDYSDPEYNVYLRPGISFPVVRRSMAPDGKLP